MDKRLILVVCIALAITPACSVKKAATNVIGRIATDWLVSVENEEDVSFAREAAPSLIKTLEVLRHGNPKDACSLTLLARSYGQYAFGYLEEDMLKFRKSNEAEYAKARKEAELFYRRGREYGIAALITKGFMREGFKSYLPEFKKALAKLGKKDVPALFWTAFNWANWLNLSLDDPAAIADLPRIQAMVDRVLELDPSYYYGSAHAFRGVIAASRSKMLGGDPELAKREFEEAMRIAPDYLMTKILYAQFYARQTQDPALFRATLKEVGGTDAAKLPGQRLANEMAKRRAVLLLAAEKQFF